MMLDTQAGRGSQDTARLGPQASRSNMTSLTDARTVSRGHCHLDISTLESHEQSLYFLKQKYLLLNVFNKRGFKS